MRITKEELLKLYSEREFSDHQIAELYGVSDVAVSKWRKKFSIPTQNKADKRKNNGFLSYKELDKETLSRLYLDEKKSGYEIAQMYGCSVAPIRGLLRQYSIPSIKKWERHNLTALPEELRPFIVGILLGDACIGYEKQGVVSRLSVSHSHKQYSYLVAIHKKFGPWARPIKCSVGISEAGKKRIEYSFRTIYHPVFRQIRSEFYKDEMRGQVPGTWLKAPPMEIFEKITAESLAYWYFDDGTYVGDPSIVVFFPLLDVEAIAAALTRATGLSWRAKRATQEHLFTLVMPSSDHDRFFQLIIPYATPDMSYKFPRKWQSQIQGERALPQEVLPFTEERLTHYQVGQWQLLDEQEQEKWVREVFLIYRQIGFPFPAEKEDSDTVRTLTRLMAYREPLSDGHVFRRSNLGLSICNGLMPHRFAAKVRGVSAWDTFNDDEAFLKVIRAQFRARSSKWVTPSHMRGALSVFGGNRTPANFRASVTKAAVDTLCPEGGTVWDPCAGFGGRLLGTVCSSKGPKYIGTEPSPDTVRGLRHLWNKVRELKKLPQDRVQILEGVAEKDCPPQDSIDLVITSPPYFSLEQYKGGPQSFLYQEYTQWKEQFLTALINNAFDCLKNDRHMVINIQNVKIDGKLIPLVTDLDALARKRGFKRFQRWWYPLNRIGKQRPDEPVLVYIKTKENVVEPLWDLNEEHITHMNKGVQKIPVCKICGVDLPGAGREGRRCEQHRKEKDAVRARNKRQEHRKTNPAKSTRVFTCTECGQEWDAPILGHFTRCPACKEKKQTAARTTVCEYRLCKREFMDTSPKNSMTYCCEEHRRREKMFRRGAVSDPSQFRKPDPVL